MRGTCQGVTGRRSSDSGSSARQWASKCCFDSGESSRARRLSPALPWGVLNGALFMKGRGGRVTCAGRHGNKLRCSTGGGRSPSPPFRLGTLWGRCKAPVVGLHPRAWKSPGASGGRGKSRGAPRSMGLPICSSSLGTSITHPCVQAPSAHALHPRPTMGAWAAAVSVRSRLWVSIRCLLFFVCPCAQEILL